MAAANPSSSLSSTASEDVGVVVLIEDEVEADNNINGNQSKGSYQNQGNRGFKDSNSTNQPVSHRSWRRAFFVDRSSWKLPPLNAVEVPASVFRLQPICAAVLLLGTPPPRDLCLHLGFPMCRCLGIHATTSGFVTLPWDLCHPCFLHHCLGFRTIASGSVPPRVSCHRLRIHACRRLGICAHRRLVFVSSPLCCCHRHHRCPLCR
ncbi:hypothetical protein EJ110_NYTH19545 [Nymphaea thermarum]|nr:hypothetical protein EJ110_NYTH19545 [Nymphaea thermarum]